MTYNWLDRRQPRCAPQPKMTALVKAQLSMIIYSAASEMGNEAKCLQSSHEIPTIHSVKCLFIGEGQEGERQTIPACQMEEVPDQIHIIKDSLAWDSVALFGVNQVLQHEVQSQ